ncbi:DNA repair protein complementing XP-C cells [Biomphalaria pfeifferi]|uniref:DNA repair protein complementing XP-C cells n=1 Tax=Biomphalaria pfeifferi TaxID=112525 RepID=A0AAD8FG47_BIOPF|nr:DNA repair protein complementing XP-C cells [Biomphalaria pfeifferi]
MSSTKNLEKMSSEKKIKKLAASDSALNKSNAVDKPEKPPGFKSNMTTKRKSAQNDSDIPLKKVKKFKAEEKKITSKSVTNGTPNKCSKKTKTRKIINVKQTKVSQLSKNDDLNKTKSQIVTTLNNKSEKCAVKKRAQQNENKVNKVTAIKKNKNDSNSKIKDATSKKLSQAKVLKKQKLEYQSQKPPKNVVKKIDKLPASQPKNSKEKLPSPQPIKPIDVNDPLTMLMMMEGNRNLATSSMGSFQASEAGASSSQEMVYSDEDSEISQEEIDSEEMSEWEEVLSHSVNEEKSQLPDKPVEITLEMPDILKHKKRNKKAFDWKLYLNRRVKRFKKEVAIDMHKVHLLCLLSLGLQQNQGLNDPTVLALAFSLLPAHLTVKSKSNLETQVENLLACYKKKFALDKINHCTDIKLIQAPTLISSISEETISDARVWVLIFIALLRSVGVTVRLVLSFQPMPFKVSENGDKSKEVKEMKNKVKKQQNKKPKSDTVKTNSSSKKSKSHESSSQVAQRSSMRESGKKAAEKNKKTLEILSHSSSDEEGEEFSQKNSKDKRSKTTKIKAKNKTEKSESETWNEDSSSEKEFQEVSFYSTKSLKKDLKILSNRKILSPSTSDEEDSQTKSGVLGHDFWLEIYFPKTKKWICFDCFKCQFGKPHSLENSATQPLNYVIGFKNDGSVRDVTARYARQWLSHTRKLRTDEEWWTQTLFMFDQTTFEERTLEDDDIKSHLLVRPMPQTIGEFKNHPLYALQRHLLKFEAIYPETAVPLGYIRKEPVYARECVRVLHSRDNWLKEGRLVRLGEKPYKMVKSRPKWNKPKENPDALDLELFGEWQTEIYMAPPAFNGKVPKNDYGNVELFKPWMLPKGTVHIKGQGMNRVAKKLNIDIAPAMIGWDHHCGCSVPLMDGWVVCEEYADTLMTAWLEDQEIRAQREQEALEKRVYGNWRRLIRGLLIKERLKKKFLQNDQLVVTAEKEATFSDGEEACDVQQSWPCNRQEKVTKKISKKGTKSKLLGASKEFKLCEVKPEEMNNLENNFGDDTKDEVKENLLTKVKEDNVGRKSSVISNERKTKLKLKQVKAQQTKVKDEETSSGESDEETDRKLKGKGIIVSQKKFAKMDKRVPEQKNKGKQSVLGTDPEKRGKARQSSAKKNKRKKKSEDETDDEESESDGGPGHLAKAAPKGRQSLSRQAKAKIKFVDKSDDEESFEED